MARSAISKGVQTSNREGSMKRSLSSLSLVLPILLLTLATPVPSAAQSTPDDEARLIAQEAYIYLYPLITMDVTRKQLTNLDPKVNPFGGPANAFTHIRTFPTAEMRV